MKNSKLILFFLIILSFNNSYNAAQCNLIASGNWSNPAIWSCGRVPVCGDFIVVPSDYVVNISSQINMNGTECTSPTYITVYGVLNFMNGNKMNLSSGSGVEIMDGGFLDGSNGGGNSNEINIPNAMGWWSGLGDKAGYFLVGNPNTLPVEFIEFNVEKVEETHEFNWSVSSERQNDYFSIDFSLDGYNWTELSIIPSIGDHSVGNKYTYTSDFNFPQHLNVYFRLSQTDKDGAYTVLDMKFIKYDSPEISVFPNPVSRGENFSVSLHSSIQQMTEIHLYNSQGLLVQMQLEDLSIGFNQLSMELINLTSGIYFVKIPSISSVDMYKLVVE